MMERLLTPINKSKVSEINILIDWVLLAMCNDFPELHKEVTSINESYTPAIITKPKDSTSRDSIQSRLDTPNVSDLNMND